MKRFVIYDSYIFARIQERMNDLTRDNFKLRTLLNNCFECLHHEKSSNSARELAGWTFTVILILLFILHGM